MASTSRASLRTRLLMACSCVGMAVSTTVRLELFSDAACTRSLPLAVDGYMSFTTMDFRNGACVSGTASDDGSQGAWQAVCSTGGTEMVSLSLFGRPDCTRPASFQPMTLTAWQGFVGGQCTQVQGQVQNTAYLKLSGSLSIINGDVCGAGAVSAGSALAPAPTPAAPTLTTVTGSFTITAPGAAKTQIEVGAKAALAVEFSVPESNVTAVATSVSRRLQEGEGGETQFLAPAPTPAPTPAGTWTVAFTVNVLSTQVAAVEQRASALGNDEASLVTRMTSQLGASASTVAVSGFTVQAPNQQAVVSGADQKLIGLAALLSVFALVFTM